MRETIRVFVRTRPTINFPHDAIILDTNKSVMELNIKQESRDQVIKNSQERYSFTFNGILHNASQETVYQLCARELLTSSLQGYNSTLMAYGQTGAGKTYTMLGPSDSFAYRGVIPRVISDLFREIQNKPDTAFTVRISYFEIYNEVIKDLLLSVNLPKTDLYSQSTKVGAGTGFGQTQKGKDDKTVYGDDLQVIEDSHGNTIVRNLTTPIATCEEEALHLLLEGNTNRAVGAHELNTHSSHCVFTIYLEMRSRIDSSAGTTSSKFHLVDLAGSERVGKKPTANQQAIENAGQAGSQKGGGTQSLTNPNTIGYGTPSKETQLLKEANYINRSLTFLEQVIVALGDRRRDHIPYRQCKLTNVLKDSLGGNCKTIMIANIQAEQLFLDETLSTCRFAQRIAKVSNDATICLREDTGAQLKRLEKEVADLREELAMHDALAGRGRMNYEQYSEEQRKDLADEMRSFVDGEFEVDDIIGGDSTSGPGVTAIGDDAGKRTTQSSGAGLSVRHVKEMLMCLRNICRQAKADAFQELKVEMMAQGGELASGAAAASLIQQQQQQSSTIGIAQPQVAGKTTATGAQQVQAKGVTSGGLTAQQSQQQTQQIKQSDSYVGDIDPHSGFGMGIALDGAPPATLKATLLSSVQPGQSNQQGQANIIGQQNAGQQGQGGQGVQGQGQQTVGSPINQQREKIGTPKPTNKKEQAFEAYKTMNTTSGPELQQQLTALKGNLKQLKNEALIKGETANGAKKQIDDIMKQLNQKQQRRKQYQQGQDDGPEDVDAEEYQLVKQMNEAKTTYKQNYDQLKLLRAEINYNEGLLETCKRKILSDFEVWYQKEEGGKTKEGDNDDEDDGYTALLKSQQKGRGAAKQAGRSGTPSNQGDQGAGGKYAEEELDTQEQFELIEREKMMAENPDAMAYYAAMKNVKQNKRSGPVKK
ncbi:MAG: putative Kinesin-II 95 kDa subunit [Streblomastix strix]|uniref:Kinesin-like protein n=1 Tax=Streblomastix strix TaxID=222440 RepID=A0A5J4WU93_9EUKA|nr:MAG: putative Kinesin-II 95 kDa subunit [Streblomastix strix]